MSDAVGIGDAEIFGSPAAAGILAASDRVPQRPAVEQGGQQIEQDSVVAAGHGDLYQVSLTMTHTGVLSQCYAANSKVPLSDRRRSRSTLNAYRFHGGLTWSPSDLASRRLPKEIADDRSGWLNEPASREGCGVLLSE